jgi:hypothetical protein
MNYNENSMLTPRDQSSMITPREPSKKELYEKNRMQPPPPQKKFRGSNRDMQPPLTARSKSDMNSYCPAERTSKNSLFGEECSEKAKPAGGDGGLPVVAETGVFLEKLHKHVSGSRCDISVYEEEGCLVLVALSPHGKQYRLRISEQDLPKMSRIKHMDSIEKAGMCQEICRKLAFQQASGRGGLELTAKFAQRK